MRRAVIMACMGIWMLLAVGCKEVPLPDADVDHSTDTRSELVIQSWETEASRLMREGCQLEGLRLICKW